MRRLGSRALVLSLSLVVAGSTAAAPSRTEILAPQGRTMVPGPGLEPPCPPGEFCNRLRVRGRIDPGYWPFLAVRPETANPRFWIQEPILELAEDGTFDAYATLGSGENGIGETFEVFILAHRSPQRFGAFEILFDLPDECRRAGSSDPPPFCFASPPISVTRTR